MSHQVTLIPGDGIGPEVAAAARRAVDATGVPIDWETVELNADVILKTGESLPQHVLDSLERTRVGLKGPGHDADRRRIHQRQRGAAQAARPVRQCASGPFAARRGDALSGREHRHGDLPREHRGSLLRPGTRSGERCGDQPESDHARRVHPHRRIRVSIRQTLPDGRK